MGRSRIAIAVLIVIGSLPWALSQSTVREDLRRHMLEHGVSLSAAATQLGVSFNDVAAAFGREGFIGYLAADRETVLVFAECVFVEVSIQGSAEKIGLSKSSLDAFANLRRANDLSFLPRCDPSQVQRGVYLSFQVWTVGDDFPVAYHISADTYIVTYGLNDVRSTSPFVAAYLGYANATRLRGVVEDTITEVVRDFALTMVRIRE